METQKTQVMGQQLVILIDGKAMLHAETQAFKMTPEMKQIYTIHTSGKENIPGDVDWSVSGSGMVIIDPNVTNANSSAEIVDMILAKKEVEVIVSIPTGESTTKSWKGKAYFSDFGYDGKVGDTATYSYSLARSSELVTYTAPES